MRNTSQLEALKCNFINCDMTVAINSYGEVFVIDEQVGNESNDETATIERFEINKEMNEVKAFTTKGYNHIDFLRKLI